MAPNLEGKHYKLEFITSKNGNYIHRFYSVQYSGNYM